MKSSNQDRVSPLTKVIVDKVHGGRKVDSKFWQSEFDNSGNDSVSIPIEKPEDLDSFLKNLKARRTLLFAGVMVLCLLYSMVYFRPDLFPFLSYSKNKPTNEHIKKAVNSLYEIELLTGGRFTTKNVKVTGDEVTFVSDRGLVVTIKKQDVKTLTRL